MGKKLVVICDHSEDISEHVLQVVSKARDLADKSNGQVTVLFAGTWKAEYQDLLSRYGTHHILVCNDKGKKSLWERKEILSDMVYSVKPDCILVPASRDGKAIAASISTKLEAGLTADCIDIDFDEEGELYFERAAMNDSVLAKIKCMNCAISMGTVKQGVFAMVEHKEGKSTIAEYDDKGNRQENKTVWTILKRSPKEEEKTIHIEQYSKVFCIGRGVKDKKTLDRICNLAQKCGAGIIGTRAVVEEGMIERERQVGQSGKSISPRIYVAFGVSGATQHMVGIKNAEIVIAINSDPNAAIFSYSDYSFVESIENMLEEMEKLAI